MEDNQQRFPIIPPAIQGSMPSNVLDAIRPYQVMYNEIMLRLEQHMMTITPRQVGRTATHEALMNQANEVRRSAEQIAGITRETQGYINRVQQYPMTPNEAYRVSIDPIRRSNEVDESSFSVFRTRQGGIMEQTFNQPIQRERRGMSFHRMVEEYMNVPREPRPIVIHTSEEGMRMWEEAFRRFAEDTERQIWYGRPSTTRTTRRDKKRKVNESPYWEYDPFD